MSISVPLRSVVFGLVGSLALVGGPALAAPARAKKKAKPARAKIERKVVKLGKAQIKRDTVTKKGTKSGGGSGGPGSVQHKAPGDVKFTLSANTPSVPYRGRIIAHYARDWIPDDDTLHPGGEIWFSQNQTKGLALGEVRIHVEAGHDYEVTLCTTDEGTGQIVSASIGNTITTFTAGDRECDAGFVLEPQGTGWTTILFSFANDPIGNSGNVFALLGVDVVDHVQP